MTQTKDDKLIKRIIELTDNPYMSKTDELIDDFVKNYDEGEWCRGHFKTMIAVLVFEAKYPNLKCKLCGKPVDNGEKDIIEEPKAYHQKCCNKHNDKVLKDSQRGIY